VSEQIYLDDTFALAWFDRSPFDAVCDIQGEVFRDVGARRTLRFTLENRSYFLKLHSGVGWKEILKNWLTLRRPVVDASNEYHACTHLRTRGVHTPRPAAFGVRGRDPARRTSFVICEALEDHVSLAVLSENWHQAPPSARLKRRLIEHVAVLARDMHDAGVVHRDFYLYHLLADCAALAREDIRLTLIDLHRARVGKRVSRYWRVRDLGALMFWCLDRPMTQRDYLRFVRIYEDRPLRAALARRPRMWRAVQRRARALYRKGLRQGIVAERFDPNA
jgi:heptose I phosphotransferase